MTKDPVSARCEMPVALDPDLVDGVLYQVKPGFYTVKSRINTIKFPNHTYPSTDGDEKPVIRPAITPITEIHCAHIGSMYLL